MWTVTVTRGSGELTTPVANILISGWARMFVHLYITHIYIKARMFVHLYIRHIYNIKGKASPIYRCASTSSKTHCSSRRTRASWNEVRKEIISWNPLPRGPPPIPPLPPPPRLTSQAAASPATSSVSSTRPPGLLEAIRGHNGVKGLKKNSDPRLVSSSTEGSFQDDLRARLAQRREAFGGDDLGSLSSLIPVDSDLKEDSSGFENRWKYSYLW